MGTPGASVLVEQLPAPTMHVEGCEPHVVPQLAVER
jgi:hypothetical protein